ncbi:MAG: hypothetical protein WC942_11870 [Clostridia bacterium]
MPKRIIVFSGKKQSGKSTGAKYLFVQIFNEIMRGRQLDNHVRAEFVKSGTRHIVSIIDGNTPTHYDFDYQNDEILKLYDTCGIRVWSFADLLKSFCISCFGIDEMQCYGTDQDKNESIHINWQDIANVLDLETLSIDFNSYNKKLTARQFLVLFGTHICRAIDPNCWARGLYNTIQASKYKYNLITDARFPNEVTLGTEIGAKCIRLLRDPYNGTGKDEAEVALDHFPLGEYSFVVNNKMLSIEDKNRELDTIFYQLVNNGYL